jgi:hypothetical protein
MAGTVEILGKQHIAALPSFGVREELCVLWGQHGQEGGHRALRVYAAAVGLSCGIGAAARADLRKTGWDLLGYGDAVYSYLREQGATSQDVVRAGVALLGEMAQDLFPREKEVDDAAGFSEGDGAERISSPPG